MPSLDTAASGNWVSLSEVARRTGVSAMAVSRRVRLLERDGLLTARSGGTGTPKLVDYDAFVHVSAKTTDAVRSINSRMATPAREKRKGSAKRPGPEPTYAEQDNLFPVLQDEQAKRAKWLAEKARIEVEEALGRLIPVAEIEDAMTRAGGTLARGLDALPTRAEEFAAVVAREGAQGLRAVLKAVVREMRERLAADMTAGDGGGDE